MNLRAALSIVLATSMSTNAFVAKSDTNRAFRSSGISSQIMMSSESEVDLGLTPELQRITDAFSAIPDEQVRYKQLLYMAQNTKEANEMPEASKIPENKVPGCLSTVFIDGTAKFDAEKGDFVIDFIGDSDGLLTKGLVALLVRGMSGNTAEEVQKVDPAFIKTAGIEQSLTPGRNNGFLNMLKVMKAKALQLDKAARESGTPEAKKDVTEVPNEEEESSSATTDSNGNGPKYNAIVQALQALKPTKLNLTDNSHQHAGHAGNDIDGESHFDLEIVAEAFDGLSLVKRHQLIYMMLGDIMPQIHALQIKSLTPAEAEK